mmetsp:Transcript_22357/g.25154  ORF Transcript_22357/g.25154 Transcript_22357/m.25154 type:complete len:118 (+) Transcript_22357:51-404(+)
MEGSSDKRVYYIVNLEIQKEIEEDFKQWLDAHVEEMIEQIDGFISAEVQHVDLVGAENDDLVRLACRYTVRDYEALKEYFETGAKKMRGDGLKRFGDKFKASRTILHTPFKIFPKSE